MKRTLLFIFSITWLSSSLVAQSKTYELSPRFEIENDACQSAPIDFAPDLSTLSFVGLSGYHFDEDYKEIHFRLLQEGQWTDWMPFPKQHEIEFGARKAYEAPFIKKAFTKVQFKSSEKLQTDFKVRFFLGEKRNLSFNPLMKLFNCELPEFCERDCWCPGCPVDNTPEITEPTHIIIHHSAGSNQSADFASVVEYIWDLHVNTNGWDDIGYNWLLDPNGVIYEGRPDNYQGAHFSCINENTVGICMIGDYTAVQPSSESITQLVNLIAFESTEHMIDATAESYHQEGDFILDNIAGHRDSAGSDNACSTTACPGDSFYPMLDSIRLLVSELPCYIDVSSVNEGYSSAFTFYPNPFSETLVVHSSVNTVDVLELVDTKGQSVATLKVKQNNSLDHLPDGLYFALHNGKFVRKILKRRL